MDLEAPADAWYVFLGVAIVSLAMTGIALSFPTTAPPNADRVANTVDRAAGSTHNATAENDHDANFFWIDGKQIALRNEGGTTRASIAFGTMTPAWHNDTLERILYGADPGEVFAGSACERLETTARDEREWVLEEVTDDGDEQEWFAASERVRVRSIHCTYTAADGSTEEVHVTLADI